MLSVYGGPEGPHNNNNNNNNTGYLEILTQRVAEVTVFRLDEKIELFYFLLFYVLFVLCVFVYSCCRSNWSFYFSPLSQKSFQPLKSL